MKIIGYDGFKYSNEKRVQETLNTIRWNTKYFDRIYIFCKTQEDYDTFESLINVKIIVERYPAGIEDMSMQDLFNAVNRRSLPEDIKCFANLDTVFSDSWNDVHIDDGVFMLLTNRTTEGMLYRGSIPSDTDEGLVLFNEKGILDPTKFNNYNDPHLHPDIAGRWLDAQCGWSWKTVLPISGRYLLGNPGVENSFVCRLREAGYKPRSGALKYPTYHNHGSNIRTTRRAFRANTGEPGEALSPSEVLYA